MQLGKETETLLLQAIQIFRKIEGSESHNVKVLEDKENTNFLYIYFYLFYFIFLPLLFGNMIRLL
jgi:hypothetical protein